MQFTIVPFQIGGQAGWLVGPAQLHHAQRRGAWIPLIRQEHKAFVLWIAMGVNACRLAIGSKATVAIEALAIEHQHLAIGTCSHQQLALFGGGQVTEL